MNRDFKGVWIPKEVWLDERLSMLDKGILAEIDSLDNGESGCFASNEHLAEFCQCSLTKVSTSISKLIELGYVTVASFDGRKRFLKSSLSKNERQTFKNCKADFQILKDSNTYRNPLNKTNNYNSRKRGTFTPPTLEEVAAYAREKGWTQGEFSAEGFVDFYGSKDWMIGKNKMTDWRKAASGWVTRYRQKNKQQTASVPKPNFMQPQARELTPDEQKAMYEAMENGTFFKNMG